MPSRRTLLAALATATAGTAGCVGGGSARGATDVYLHNRTTTQQSVDLTVTDADGDEVHVDRTLALEPAGEAKVNNHVLMDADYTVEVAADGGPSETHEWTDAGAPLHVVVDGSENLLFAVQVG